MTELLAACDVSKGFGTGALVTWVLRDVSLTLRSGELVLLVGPSGSGKTTLLGILAGLLRPTSGAVRLCDHQMSDLSEARAAAVRRRHVGLVLQRDHLFPALSAVENVAEVMVMKGMKRPQALSEARAALGRLGLGSRANARPADLSGGERQRVAVARALAGDPQVILGDEPTAALDGSAASAIVEILRALAQGARGVLVVTHDRRLERWAHRVLVLEDGRIRSEGGEAVS